MRSGESSACPDVCVCLHRDACWHIMALVWLTLWLCLTLLNRASPYPHDLLWNKYVLCRETARP